MSVKIITGDTRQVLKEMSEDTFDCCVTSPPYYGLRDYQVAGQIGLEPTLDAYLAEMVAVCREVRRVLKPSGTFFLNIGDSYAGSGRGGNPEAGTKQGTNRGSQSVGVLYGKEDADREAERERIKDGNKALIRAGLKPKDLMMVPARLALALQEPWYAGKIKSIADRIWLAAMIDAEGCMFIHKRKAGDGNHSKYTKLDGTVSSYSRTQDTYGSGLEVANTSLAIVERCQQITGIGSICSQSPKQNSCRRQTIYRWNVRSNECRWIVEEVYPHLVGKQHQARVLLGCPSSGEKAAAAHAALIDLHNGKSTDVDFKPPQSLHTPGWFIRSEIVWAKKNCMPESVTDRPTSAHEKIWLLTKSERYHFDAAAVREEDGARASGRGFKRDHRLSYAGRGKEEQWLPGGGRNVRNVWTMATQPFAEAHFATFPPELAERCIKAGCPIGGHVLDPFGGAGTTGLVADRLQRSATLIELNPAYAAMASKRIDGDSPLFAASLLPAPAPVSRGGSNHPSNLVVACRSCNSSKGSLLLTEWKGRRGNYR